MTFEMVGYRSSKMRFVLYSTLFISRSRRTFPRGDGYILAVNNIPPNNDANVFWKFMTKTFLIFAFTENEIICSLKYIVTRCVLYFLWADVFIIMYVKVIEI